MAPGKDDRLSSEREAAKAAFLAEHGLADAVREPLTGDASTRLYERLRRPGWRCWKTWATTSTPG